MTSAELAITPAPGLYPAISFDDYKAWDAANQSLLIEMEESAADCKLKMDEPDEPTDAMSLGSLLDAALLDPAELEKYVVWTGGPRNVNPAKRDWPIWLAEQEAAGKIVLEDGDAIAKAKGMVASLRASKMARMYLDAPGESQVSMIWRAPCGLLCKGRMDRFVKIDGRPTIIDLKTTERSIRSAGAIGKLANDMGWHFQAAAYTEGVELLTGNRPDHALVIVEQKPPHKVAVRFLGDQTMQSGRVTWERCCREFMKCRTAGIWPGLPDKVEVIEIPHWALEQEVC